MGQLFSRDRVAPEVVVEKLVDPEDRLVTPSPIVVDMYNSAGDRLFETTVFPEQQPFTVGDLRIALGSRLGEIGRSYEKVVAKEVWRREFRADERHLTGFSTSMPRFYRNPIHAFTTRYLMRSGDFGVTWFQEKGGMVTRVSRTDTATNRDLYREDTTVETRDGNRPIAALPNHNQRFPNSFRIVSILYHVLFVNHRIYSVIRAAWCFYIFLETSIRETVGKSDPIIF